ncbi:hypothetical protein BU17DRAFT_93730 [Hysterangium stoloniferum]|nr:hypothetical protein BU17DRAFT_93730 [Hysterangium stoloniferum]
MKFTSLIIASATLLGSASNVVAQFCSEATRFGILNVSPTTLAIGDSFTVSLNLTCGISNFGLIPSFLDYYISVPVNNNGHEPDILIARHTFDPTGPAFDSFTTTLPNTTYFTGASYQVVVHNINHTPSGTVLTVGEIEAGISITGI